MATTITSANAVLTLAIVNLFDTPQQLTNFAAEDIYTVEPRQTAEVAMGVDGILSGGFVFVPTTQSISLMADSPSNQLFDDWVQAQETQKDIYYANAVIILQSLQQKWVMTKGVLTSYPPLADAARVLRPRRFTIQWENVSQQPIA